MNARQPASRSTFRRGTVARVRSSANSTTSTRTRASVSSAASSAGSSTTRRAAEPRLTDHAHDRAHSSEPPARSAGAPACAIERDEDLGPQHAGADLRRAAHRATLPGVRASSPTCAAAMPIGRSPR
jgi:hypothetical protein